MICRACLKLKITVVILGTSLLLQPSLGLSAAVDCGSTIKNLAIDPQSLDQKIQNLSALKLSLDLAKVNGALSTEIGSLKAHYESKEKELVAYLTKNKIMTRKQLIEKIKQQIAVLQGQNKIGQRSEKEAKDAEARRKKAQEELIKNSFIDGTKAISHRITPGPFEMGEVGMQKSVTLTKAFDMMATATTQLLYKAVANLANVKFPQKYDIAVDPSNFKGDLNPVEKVSYEDVQTWLRALNELSQAGESMLTDLIPGHKQGDVYRLPTEAEWEFVTRGRGTFNETYHFGDKKSDRDDHAWYNANAGSTTHPVAQKKPLVFENKDFYDMHGNVWEWVHDWYDKELLGGIDPQGPSTSSFRVIRGGSWSSYALGLGCAFRGRFSPDGRNLNLGFRFVRTVP